MSTQQQPQPQPPQPQILIPTPLPTPLPTSLLHPLISHLISTNQMPAIHSTLMNSCVNFGWEAALRARVMEMLRTREYRNASEVKAAIVREGRGLDGEEDNDDDEDEVGKKRNEGKGREGGMKKGKGKEKERQGTDIRIPASAVTDSVKIISAALDGVVEFEMDEKEYWQ